MSTFEIKPKDDEKPAKQETHIEVHADEDEQVNVQPAPGGTVDVRVTHSAESEQEDS